MTVTGHDHRFHECLFEHSLGDGIKTLRGDAMGVLRPLVGRCVHQHDDRDGIDTTGGFQDGVIDDTIFRTFGLGTPEASAVLNFLLPSWIDDPPIE